MIHAFTEFARRCIPLVVCTVLSAICLSAVADDKASKSKKPKKPKAPKTAAVKVDAGALRWKFKEGDEIAYTLEQKMDVSAMGQGIKIAQVHDITWKIGSVTDGSAAIVQKFNNVSFS